MKAWLANMFSQSDIEAYADCIVFANSQNAHAELSDIWDGKISYGSKGLMANHLFNLEAKKADISSVFAWMASTLHHERREDGQHQYNLHGPSESSSEHPLLS